MDQPVGSFIFTLFCLSITVQIPHKCPTSQNEAKNHGGRLKKEKKHQGRSSDVLTRLSFCMAIGV